MQPHAPAKPLEGALLLGLRAYFQVPKSKPRKFKDAALLDLERPQAKPDLDNILKFVKDCMSGLFFYDDKQVVGYLEGTGKYYADCPRMEFKLVTLEECNAREANALGLEAVC